MIFDHNLHDHPPMSTALGSSEWPEVNTSTVMQLQLGKGKKKKRGGGGVINAWHSRDTGGSDQEHSFRNNAALNNNRLNQL